MEDRINMHWLLEKMSLLALDMPAFNRAFTFPKCMNLSCRYILLLLLFVGNAAVRADSDYLLPVRSEPVTIEELSLIPLLEIEYYAIEGASLKELKRSIKKSRRTGPFGKKRDAFVHWSVSWKWPGIRGRGDFKNIRVSYQIKVTLPRWANRKGVDKELIRKWEMYMRALLLHEWGHVELFRAHVGEIAPVVRDAYLKDPQLSAREANALAKGVLDKIRELDLKYDKVTKHGATQGARLL